MAANPYVTPDSTAGNQSLSVESSGSIRRIKRFGVLQLGKMLGVLYFCMSLLAVPFLILATIIGGSERAGFGFGMIVMIPVLYTIAGFISGVIGAWVYNLCAKFVGGVEVEVV